MSDNAYPTKPGWYWAKPLDIFGDPHAEWRPTQVVLTCNRPLALNREKQAAPLHGYLWGPRCEGCPQ